MACLIFVKESYLNPRSVANTINYATKKCGVQVNYFGGYSVDDRNPRQMIYQFNAVKNAFYKSQENHRQVRHFILSFDEKDTVTPYEAYLIAHEVASYYSNQFQIVYGVHENTENLHIHFILNTVSYVDGHLFTEGIFQQRVFLAHTYMVLQRLTNCKVDLINLTTEEKNKYHIQDINSLED